MIISAYKSRLKKIAIAVLLLSFASWTHEGLVICYGADGHVEIERPSEKDCCKTIQKCTPTLPSELSEPPHCVDVPIGAAQYIVSTSHRASFQNHVIPLSVVSPLIFSPSQTCRVVCHRTMPPYKNPLQETLKTIVLLI